MSNSPQHPVDLRSDTVTKPSPAMRAAMAQAEVGDDVYGEDPSINRLQSMMAERLGKEAALFVPSGSMANQIAVRVHTRPGDEVILERTAHSFLYETGALGGINGVQAHPVEGDQGLLNAPQVEAAIRPAPDHYARTSLIIAENTANGGGGTFYTPEALAELGKLARRRSLRFHLDGARLFNASVASGASLQTLAKPCDSVSACFSKGLGAPVGSILAGDRAFIHEAHRARKMFGGGMRQAGILAVAALYALENNVDRLSEDHENLRRLMEGLSKIEGLEGSPERYPTNIGYLQITREGLSATQLVKSLKSQGVLTNPTGPKEIRVVTHLDVDRPMIDLAIERFAVALK